MFTDSRTIFYKLFCLDFVEWEQHMFGFYNIINFVERGKYLISFHVSSVISVDSRVSSSRDLFIFYFVLVESKGINSEELYIFSSLISCESSFSFIFLKTGAISPSVYISILIP